MYYRTRWYDPTLGRFVSEDPMGFEAGDANLSRSVGKGVTGATDPTGLDGMDIKMKYRELAQKRPTDPQIDRTKLIDLVQGNEQAIAALKKLFEAIDNAKKENSELRGRRTMRHVCKCPPS